MLLMGLRWFPSFLQETRVQLQEELVSNIMMQHSGDKVYVSPHKKGANILLGETALWSGWDLLSKRRSGIMQGHRTTLLSAKFKLKNSIRNYLKVILIFFVSQKT